MAYILLPLAVIILLIILNNRREYKHSETSGQRVLRPGQSVTLMDLPDYT